MAKRRFSKTLVPDFERDIKEWYIREQIPEVLDLLLIDRTTGKNIMWGTKDYESRGKGFGEWDEIKADLIANESDKVIVPRVCKDKDEQQRRIKNKGEVFTPAWICNAMNNLVDNAWFARPKAGAGFNQELEKGWRTIRRPIKFSKKLKKTWQDYVSEVRLEITCGEAPFLASRYDMANLAASQTLIPVDDRIGILDRKLRVLTENCRDECKWIEWAKKAVQGTLGYDWQGDNVFLARENILWTVLETFHTEFNGAKLSPTTIVEFANIISWNIWQMDGLKFVVPNTCHEKILEIPNLDGTVERKVLPCKGCNGGKVSEHNGVRCRVMDWEIGKSILFMPPFEFKPVED